MKYNVSENLWDLLLKLEHGKKIFVEGYKLINLQTISDELLRQRLCSGTLEFFMKNSRMRNLLKLWQEISNNLLQIIKVHHEKDYLEIFLAYTLTHMLKNDIVKVKNLLKEKLQDNLGENIMISFAQQ